MLFFVSLPTRFVSFLNIHSSPDFLLEKTAA
jgi:hypothetical protein